MNSTLPYKEEKDYLFLCLSLQKEEEKTKDNSNEFTLYFKIFPPPSSMRQLASTGVLRFI